ncbi:hypothetical protein [Pontiella agarivorans]|uniref:Gfo/Idh/MocA-like oxidoreductase N-terminal domain-containing protein n=1 Tax=Pontiella agarivorans TaxID=3038953 RepID=A0ABU5MW52_9BACT|nr:hypothetical protein [Pontiella agarivorans]MDZ8118459.1 hypothetical protein [Pontiella agarivorans]
MIPGSVLGANEKISVATVDAMRRGKHVCTQKPLTHTMWEARLTNPEVMNACGYPEKYMNVLKAVFLSGGYVLLKGVDYRTGGKLLFAAPFTEMMLLDVLASRFGG